MVIADKKIERITKNDLQGSQIFQLVNCIVGKIDLVGASRLDVHLVIENCLINDLQIHSCWFEHGFLLKGNIIKNYVDYQMGGHNSKPIFINGNIFVSFFNFFDCQFKEVLELKNNVFQKGSNLLGNKGEGFENIFGNGWIVENNVGNVDLDGLGTY